MPSYRDLARQALDAQRKGLPEKAVSLYRQALEAADAGDPPEDLDSTHANLGSLLYDTRDLAGAEEVLRKGIQLARRASHPGTEAALRRYMGRLLRDQGRLKDALQEAERSEKLLRAHPDESSLLSTLGLLSELAERLDDLERAGASAAGALEIASRLGRPERAAELKRRVKQMRDLDLSRSDREALWEEFRNLQRLQQVTAALNTDLDFQRLLNLIMDTAVEIAGAERGFLILQEPTAPLKIAAARNVVQEDLQRPEFRFSRSIVQRCMESGEAVRADDAQSDSRFEASESVKDLRLRSVFCVPFRAKGRIIGALYLDHPFKREAFRPAVQRLLEGLSDQAALCLENARLNQENVERRKTLEKHNRGLAERVETADREIARLEETLALERKAWALRYNYEAIVTRSPEMRAVLHLLDRITESDVPVLVHGESGTGKELVAKALHVNGPRRARHFLTVNCAALTASLLESELFGHVRGAFTGATGNKEGLFQAADGGTLFLDEIGEMPAPLQAKLLRVLQDGELTPVGSSKPLHVDVRVISATHRRLEDMVKRGEFREDLFYRLKVVTVELPPLRERREDVPVLIERFLQAGPKGARRPRVTPEAMALLTAGPWPGNVRQLLNEVRRWQALSLEAVRPEDLGPEVRGGARPRAQEPSGASGSALPLREALAHVERESIRRAMGDAAGRKSAAARALGISRPTLDKKLKEYGL